jgi:hypothetical protein
MMVAVMGFACEADARRALEVLSKRFARFGLTLHPTKTRLVKFTRLPYRDPPKDQGPLITTGYVRPVGLDPLLGPFATRQLDREAQDSPQPPKPIPSHD